MMFSPTQRQVREFFCTAWKKSLDDCSDMQAIEVLAAGWIKEHPEWHCFFENLDLSLSSDFGNGAVGENPFLHLSMHLSISEQCSIDQPRGIRQAVELLARKTGDLHKAHHIVMECLGQMLADAQNSGKPPDGNTYVERIQRIATKD